MKTTIDIGLTAVFAGLYAVLVLFLAPIAFGPVQLRVADCLIPLAALLGWPVASGVTLGCFLGNAYFGLGPHDIILGPIANFAAATLVFMLRRRYFIASIIGAVPIGVIVGGYLGLYFPPPDIFGLTLPVWGAMIISIMLSSLIAMGIIGYALLRVFKISFASSLKSLGLRIYNEN